MDEWKELTSIRPGMIDTSFQIVAAVNLKVLIQSQLDYNCRNWEGMKNTSLVCFDFSQNYSWPVSAVLRYFLAFTLCSIYTVHIHTLGVWRKLQVTFTVTEWKGAAQRKGEEEDETWFSSNLFSIRLQCSVIVSLTSYDTNIQYITSVLFCFCFCFSIYKTGILYLFLQGMSSCFKNIFKNLS